MSDTKPFTRIDQLEKQLAKAIDLDFQRRQQIDALAQQLAASQSSLKACRELSDAGLRWEQELVAQLAARDKQLADAADRYDGAISELQAAIDTGALSVPEHEELEADICARITAYWERPKPLEEVKENG